MKTKIVIYGTGGHAKVIRDIIDSGRDFEAVAYFDDHPEKNTFQGLPVWHSEKDLQQAAAEKTAAVVAIGKNDIRQSVYSKLQKMGFHLPTLIHSSAILSPSAQIGAGTVVMPGVKINADTRVGEACIINTGANIDHDCQIGSFTHVAPGCTLCGNIHIGEVSFVGAGTTIIPNKNIGSRVVLGAGTLVTKDLTQEGTYVGVPAKTIGKR